MDTHEFQFPGGSAVITTTTGGTRDAPDFCITGASGTFFQGSWSSVFAAEILKLAGRVAELESALAAAGEGRENMEIRLSGRIAELEAEIERRAAENIAVQDKSRSVTETLLAVVALFKGTPEAKIAKLEAENRRLLAGQFPEVAERIQALAEENEKLKRRVEDRALGMESLNRIRERLVEENEKLRADLAVAIKTGEEQAQRLRHDSVVMAQLDENIKQLHRQVRDAVADATFDRLSRLDALLSSAEAPNELVDMIGRLAPTEESTFRGANKVWQWFRDLLRDQIDDPVPEVERRLGALRQERDATADRLYDMVMQKEPGPVAEKPVAVRTGNASWYAGLSMEEVYDRIQAGTAPGSSGVGGCISVPDGFLGWLAEPGPGRIFRSPAKIRIQAGDLNTKPTVNDTMNLHIPEWIEEKVREEAEAGRELVAVLAKHQKPNESVAETLNRIIQHIDNLAKENAKLKTELDATIKYSINSNDAKTGRSLAAILAQHCLEGESVTEALNRIIREWEARHKTAMQFIAENARLNNLLGGNARAIAAHEACIAQHEKENARLLEILRELEWEGATQEPQYPCCPVCARDETSGHYADCRLGRALATKEKHPMEERYGLSDVFRGSAGSQKIMKHGGPDAIHDAPAFAVCGEHGYCQLPAGHDGEHMGPPSHQPSDAD